MSSQVFRFFLAFAIATYISSAHAGSRLRSFGSRLTQACVLALSCMSCGEIQPRLQNEPKPSLTTSPIPPEPPKIWTLHAPDFFEREFLENLEQSPIFSFRILKRIALAQSLEFTEKDRYFFVRALETERKKGKLSKELLEEVTAELYAKVQHWEAQLPSALRNADLKVVDQAVAELKFCSVLAPQAQSLLDNIASFFYERGNAFYAQEISSQERFKRVSPRPYYLTPSQSRFLMVPAGYAISSRPMLFGDRIYATAISEVLETLAPNIVDRSLLIFDAQDG